MEKFIESIKVVNGEMQNISYHLDRVKRTIGRSLQLPMPLAMETEAEIAKHRIVYTDGGVITEVSTTPYYMHPIHSLRVVKTDFFNYHLKFEDRRSLNFLFEQRGEADDVLIVCQGRVTDTSYCNVVFKNEEGLFTPKAPLLAGTKRQKLLDEGVIQERAIRIEDLSQFTSVFLINAMIELGDLELPISRLFF